MTGKKLLCSDWLRTGKFMVIFSFHCSAKIFDTWHLQVSQLWILMNEWSYGSSKRTSNLCRIYTALNVRFFFFNYAVPENIILPQKKGLKFCSAQGFSKGKTFKEKVWSSIGISREVWICSWTTLYMTAPEGSMLFWENFQNSPVK